jgi:hypothetical protein
MERSEAERARLLEALITRKREELAERRAAGAITSAKEVQIVAAAGLAAALAAWLTGIPGGLLGGLERGHPLFFGLALGLLAAGYLKLRSGSRETRNASRPEGVVPMLWGTVVLLGMNLATSLLGPLPFLP